MNIVTRFFAFGVRYRCRTHDSRYRTGVVRRVTQRCRNPEQERINNASFDRLPRQQVFTDLVKLL